MTAVDTAPSFASAKAADVILSDVRPTTITEEALRSVNILLDELLWLILAHARSLDTNRLKSGVLKTIPTQLGKDAILEAEIEIRAYRDKTNPSNGFFGSSNSPSRLFRSFRSGSDDAVQNSFPLKEVFEWMRRRCQVLSSFGDIEEDPYLEEQLLEAVRLASPVLTDLESSDPAPLYATAVIEHICQHVLSNIARVVARDSSRTTADLQDVFTSMCEDILIYPVFKTMKVSVHIHNHLPRPFARLSTKKSIVMNNGSASPERTASPTTAAFSPAAKAAAASPSASSHGAGRNSVSESTTVSGSTSNLSTSTRVGSTGFRKSHDRKSKHGRTESVRSAAASSDGESALGNDPAKGAKMALFDELLQGGGTMKISITPDRMKTFEMEEKVPRAAILSADDIQLPKRTKSPPPSAHSPTMRAVPPILTSGAVLKSPRTTTPIIEEETSPAGPEDSDVHNDNAQLSPTGTVRRGPSSAPPRSQSPPATFPTIGHGERRTRRTPSSSVDVTDDDDALSEFGASSIEGQFPPVPAQRRQRSATESAQSVRSVRTTKVSTGTRDLVAFLDSGPPQDFGPPPVPSTTAFDQRSMSASSISSGSNKASGGRLKNMVSRLRRAQSGDKLKRSPSFDARESSDYSNYSGRPSNGAPASSSIASMNGRRGPYAAGSGTADRSIDSIVASSTTSLSRTRSQHNTATTPNGPPPSSWQALPAPPKPPPVPKPDPIKFVPELKKEPLAPSLTPTNSASLSQDKFTSSVSNEGISSQPLPSTSTRTRSPDPPALPTPTSIKFNQADIHGGPQDDVSRPHGSRSPSRKAVPAVMELALPTPPRKMEVPTPADPSISRQEPIAAPPLVEQDASIQPVAERTDVTMPALGASGPAVVPSSIPATVSEVVSLPFGSVEEWHAQANLLREYIGRAEHLSEAALLVDMFLVRAGVPLTRKSDNATPFTVPTLDAGEPVAFVPALAFRETSTIETLLGEAPLVRRLDKKTSTVYETPSSTPRDEYSSNSTSPTAGFQEPGAHQPEVDEREAIDV